MARTPQEARRFLDLDPRERRRVMLWAIVRTSASVVAILAIYFLVPTATSDDLDAVTITIRVLLCLALFVFALFIRFRRISQAALPAIRALESAVTALVLFLVLVAFIHLSISRTWPDAYSQPLTTVTALYFTTTVFATVGFGDIVARTDGARLFVTAQMVVDLAVLALIARVLFLAARTRLEGRSVEDVVRERQGR